MTLTGVHTPLHTLANLSFLSAPHPATTTPPNNQPLHAQQTALLFSWPYTAAMTAGVAEFLLEVQLCPQLKQQQQLVSRTGLALVVLGEALRKLAMVRRGG